jgi:hypothetical protein
MCDVGFSNPDVIQNPRDVTNQHLKLSPYSLSTYRLPVPVQVSPLRVEEYKLRNLTKVKTIVLKGIFIGQNVPFFQGPGMMMSMCGLAASCRAQGCGECVTSIRLQARWEEPRPLPLKWLCAFVASQPQASNTSIATNSSRR